MPDKAMRGGRWHISSGLFVCCLTWCGGGCATHADRVRDARTQFYAGELEAATKALDKKTGRHHSDDDLFRLDRALVDLTAGHPQECEQLLREVRDHFDYFEQTSVSEHVLATLSDDQRIAYAGEDYEKIFIRAFLALASLMQGGEDAAAYALQVTDKQQQIMDAGADGLETNPKLSYKRVALGAYIHGVLREATHQNYDDAERSYAKVVEWEPNFRAGPEDLERVRTGHHSAPGNGVVYVFTLVGRGPYKEQASEIPTTAALLIADRIISLSGRHSVPPSLAPVKVPRVVVFENPVNTVTVQVDGQNRGATETIADVGRFAAEQYQAIYPHVMARAVARRAIKKGVIYATKEVAGINNQSLTNLAIDAAGVAWEATEAADTRCWSLLPDKIQVLRLELPAGEHELSLRATAPTQHRGPEYHTTVPVANGRNTYVLANFPDYKLIGQVMVSR